MSSFDDELSLRLGVIRDQGLYRELRRMDSPQGTRINFEGKTLLNFSSNDYLGLANDPIIKEASIKAVECYGAGSGASRLICGSLGIHHELDAALADFKQTEAALSFSSGYATAVGTITALMSKDDVVVLDKLVHAAIVDAARLCGAKLRVFAHNDLNDLEAILKWADQRNIKGSEPLENRKPRTLIVTESVFSMDGDTAPLRELVDLKDRYGAWLMVDEAHATGVYGLNRRGVAEQTGASERVEIQMGTLGKALGSAGGYICGSKLLIDYLVNRARSFIFSTAPVPAAAGAAVAAVRFVQSNEGKTRCENLWRNIRKIRGNLIRSSQQFEGRILANADGPILPLLVGEENRAMEIANALRSRGLFIPAVRFPTVARGEARLRLTMTAAHQPGDIEVLSEALTSLKAYA